MANQDQADEGKKKPSLVLTIAIVAGLSVAAGGGGWFVGNMLAPQVEPPKVEKAEEKPAEGGDPRCRELPHHWIRKVLNMRRDTLPSEIISARSSRSSLRYWKPRGPSICWRETVLR